MDRFSIGLSVLFVSFFLFMIAIGSVAGIVQLLFMVLVYLFRKPLRSVLRLVTRKDFFLVVFFGTLFGLVEEVLWFVFEPGIQQTMFSSLYVDLKSTFPVYLIFYLVVYTLAKWRRTTQNRAFLYGGIFGYIFYFIAESGLFGFQIGGVLGAPIYLVMIWEINNFFLNGLLVWFPLYLSDLLSDSESG